MYQCKNCGFRDDTNNKPCPICDTNDWEDEDIKLIESISDDESFLNAMEELKQNDIIEYKLKISQIKNQINQQNKTLKQEPNKPRCPYCSSTNLTKISATSRVASTLMFGIGSKKIGKQWKCNNCKSCF